MRLFTSAVGVATAMLLSAAAADAQTAGTSTATGAAPSVNLVYAGGFVGVGAVQNAKAIFGGEVGVHVYHNIDVVVEGGFDSDGITRQIGRAHV